MKWKWICHWLRAHIIWGSLPQYCSCSMNHNTYIPEATLAGGEKGGEGHLYRGKEQHRTYREGLRFRIRARLLPTQAAQSRYRYRGCSRLPSPPQWCHCMQLETYDRWSKVHISWINFWHILIRIICIDKSKPKAGGRIRRIESFKLHGGVN